VGDVTLVVAVCDGHPSEVADAWRKRTPRAVFALWDAKSLTVSLRRSEDCEVDLSKVAERLGGGGHAAASGCEMPELRRALAELIVPRVAEALP
jgi:nanoRNase/pAp phosphatase (c-di-AMP/oligoRNAs hydrolase)